MQTHPDRSVPYILIQPLFLSVKTSAFLLPGRHWGRPNRPSLPRHDYPVSQHPARIPLHRPQAKRAADLGSGLPDRTRSGIAWMPAISCKHLFISQAGGLAFSHASLFCLPLCRRCRLGLSAAVSDQLHSIGETFQPEQSCHAEIQDAARNNLQNQKGHDPQGQ